jgi:uncharacterized coiled-coil protein SlyX
MADLDEIISSGGESAPVETVETQQKEVAEATPASEPESRERETDAEQRVPVAALQKEREKAKRYTEQVAESQREISELKQTVQQLVNSLQAQQPTPQAPEFWEQPEQAIDYRLNQVVTPIQQALVQQREEVSRMMATEKFGESAINEAYETLASMRGSPDFSLTYRQIMSSPHPYGALVDWHRKQQVLSEIGSDPAAYKEKLKAEVRAELQGSGGVQQHQATPSVMPSNFATAPNRGARTGPSWSGPTPLADIFARK